MTLEQCIAKYSTALGAPGTGAGPTSLVLALLPYILIILAIATIFGIYFFNLNRHTRRAAAHIPRHYNKHHTTRTALFSLLAFATLLTGGLTLTTQSYAQTVPDECKHLIDNDDDDDNTTTPPVPETFQELTRDYCTNHMQVYRATGSDENRILELKDTRGGIEQTYRVAKLADNNCWMLDNLKLGSTTQAITLTPQDSNVTTNFTLPQLNDGTRTMDYSTNPGNDYDAPYAYGPVPGDTGSGATNYGYLYNFSAATAGETRTSLPTGDAPNSICAAGWRLPRSGYVDTSIDYDDWEPLPANDFVNLDKAFGGTGRYAYSGETNITKWQYDGPFKGVHSGYWFNGYGSYGFEAQDDSGWLWSVSANSGDPEDALLSNFGSSDAYPGNTAFRGNGFGVRCLLN